MFRLLPHPVAAELAARLAVQRHRRWGAWAERAGLARLRPELLITFALGNPDPLPACPCCRRALDLSARKAIRERHDAVAAELTALAQSAAAARAGRASLPAVAALLALMLSEKIRNGLRNLCLRWPWLLRPALARALFSPGQPLAALGRPDPLAGCCPACLRPPLRIPFTSGPGPLALVPAAPSVSLDAPTIAEAIAEYQAALARADFEAEYLCHALRAHALDPAEANAELARNRPAALAFARLHPELLEGAPA